MAVRIERKGDLGVTEDLHHNAGIHVLCQEEGSAAMAQVVEPLAWKTYGGKMRLKGLRDGAGVPASTTPTRQGS